MNIHNRIGIFLTLQRFCTPLISGPMRLIKLYVSLLFLCLLHSLDAQTILSRVTFPVDEHQTYTELAKAGIDLSHGHGKQGSFFTTEIQDFELARLSEMGIRYTIDIPDMSRHRLTSVHPQKNGLLECQDRIYDEVVPRNFELGEVGGFFSLPEVLDHLDAMAILYPHLISARQPIGDIKTWNNNSIFWVRISDNPDEDEQEPEILYTSLHHAKEFISVSQTIYFMWYVLENYDKDPLIKQMLDQTEMYFVPVINPDGLDYNVEGYDAIEGIFANNHRKNLRDNNNDGEFDPKIDGVDLNRNYGYEWGYDDIGSSPSMSSDTYRGPFPFSEPETQAIKLLCESHDFKFALNYHGYGNLLIYPWGYNNKHTIDSTAYTHYGELLTDLNGFVYGLGEETVGYVTNGDSDDWMYGDQGFLALTPEVGDNDDGFYPNTERIIPLCQSTLEMNLLSARLINSLIAIIDETPRFIQPGVNPLQLEFNRYGLLNGEITITFNPLSPHILEVPEPILIDLEKFEPHERMLSFTVNNSIPYGSSVGIEVICRQGNYTFRDTLVKVRGDFAISVDDTGDLNNWDRTKGQKWGVTNAAFKSGPTSITDSPIGVYGPNENQIIVLKEQIDLTDVTAAYAQFWAKWEIEDQYDYVVFQASTDGQSWENLCGERSKLGGVFQVYEEPLYDGKQPQWVLETVDLENYLGQQIRLRFLIVTDGFVFRDGFYFDDLKVITIKEELVATTESNNSNLSVYPNPAAGNFTIELPEIEKPSVVVYNTLGEIVYSYADIKESRLEISSAAWPDGLYFYSVASRGIPMYNGIVSLLH